MKMDYLKMPHGVLYNCPAEILQQSLETASVDHVITDGPYGLGKLYGGILEPNSREGAWESLEPIYREWRRIVRQNGVIAFFQARRTLFHETFLSDRIG